jgi:hypothetical protein
LCKDATAALLRATAGPLADVGAGHAIAGHEGFLVAHALPGGEAERFAGRALVGLEEGDVAAQGLVGRVRPVEQQVGVGYVQRQVQQAVTHLGLHPPARVGGLRKPKLALAQRARIRCGSLIWHKTML